MENQSVERNRAIRIVAFILISLVAVAGSFVAYEQYHQKLDYMAQTVQEKQTQVKLVNESYDRIESNLAKITEHENMIQKNMTDAETASSLAPEERIQNEIAMIDQLISENNALIANLNQQIDEKDTRLAGYEKTTRELKAKVGEYKEMVDALVADKEALQRNLDETTVARNNLAVEVDNLGNEVAQKTSVIEDQNQQLLEKERNLHTAYYTVGTYKSLRDQNIVDKEGGFLGINTVKTLSNNLDPKEFKEIDTREVTEIPVNAKHCEIITSQDPSTYSLVYENEKVSSIKISNPDKFWGKTKYLVVVIRENNAEDMTTASSR